MLKYKKIKRCLKYTAVLCLIFIFSGLLHYGIASFVVSKNTKNLSWFQKHKISVVYDSVKPAFCFFHVCIKAKNVQIRTKSPSLTFCPVDLMVQKALFGNYQIKAVAANPPHQTASQADKCMRLLGQIEGSRDFWHVNQLTVMQGNMGGTVSGDVDMIGESIKLEGETINLSDFAALFIPKDFRFLAMLAFSNGRQNISIRSDENYILIFDMPILPKSIIFQH